MSDPSYIALFAQFYRNDPASFAYCYEIPQTHTSWGYLLGAYRMAIDTIRRGNAENSSETLNASN